MYGKELTKNVIARAYNCTLLNILNEKHFTLSNSDNQQQNYMNKSQSNSLPENSLEISLYRKDDDKPKPIEVEKDLDTLFGKQNELLSTVLLTNVKSILTNFDTKLKTITQDKPNINDYSTITLCIRTIVYT
ncbi:unnamed protein product [Adineta steineri]|uniref:Uncharacterized protein n=1 Tax=Adineta steineri TaxID=433720 RepID=A0A820BMW9_9BILA|nr:unnamed protein product [Adineta steineri]